MTLVLALALQAAVTPQSLAPTTPAPAPVPAEPPRDWSTLPSIPLPPASGDMVRFVREEVRTGRCTRSRTTDDGQVVLVVPMALRLNAESGARSVVPLAIGCPTVEQFSAGAAQRMLRNLPHRDLLSADRWYRTVITYTWPG